VKSFSKSEWELSDYPIRVLHRPEVQPLGRRRPYSWTAQIINWWHMRGDGHTREEAVLQLERRFTAFKIGNPLPRPGRGAPLKVEMASSAVVDEHQDLVADLLERVIGINPSDCLVTDESSLWDFHDGDTNEPYVRKIALLYAVDVSDVEPPTVAAICQKIREHGGA
jgi:hypothetical protein